MVGPAVVAVPVDQAIVRGVRAAERARPVGRPGAMDVEAKAELPRRAVAGRGRPEGARVEAQLGRGAVVARPADREGLPPRAAVEWPAAGALEAPLAKVALVKVAPAGRRLSIHAKANSDEDVGRGFAELEAQLLSARGHDEQLKALDEALVGKDFAQ